MMDYQCRFIPQRNAAELVNLYHLARTPLSNSKHPLLVKGLSYNHARQIWAADAYHREHPEVSAMGAYKDLDGLLEWPEVKEAA